MCWTQEYCARPVPITYNVSAPRKPYYASHVPRNLTPVLEYHGNCERMLSSCEGVCLNFPYLRTPLADC